MNAFPQSLRDGFVTRALGADLLVLAPGHRVHQLDPVAAWVWQHADGETAVADLAAGLRSIDAAADEALVFEALDRLADAGLLRARVAPPSGLSRRVLLRQLAGAGAIAALTAAVGVPRSAWAAEGGLCADDKALIAEIAWLEAENGAIAEYLDEWAEEAADGDDADEYYIAELQSREALYKKKESAYVDLGKDAKLDLAECKVAKKKVNVADREEKRKQHFAGRQEQLEKTSLKRDERHVKRQVKRKAQEASYKQKVTANEAAQKDKLKAKQKSDEKSVKSAAKAEAKVAASTEKLQSRLGAMEKHRKLQLKHREQRAKHLELRRESAMKHLDKRLVDGEEKAKAQADAYALKATEETAKQAGVDDTILERAQEEAIKAQASAEQKHKGDDKAAEQNIKAEQAKEKTAKQAQAQEQKVKLEQKAAETKAKQAAEQDTKASF